MQLLPFEIELLSDLSQIEYEDQFYDFHNEYVCASVIYEKNALALAFKHIKEGFQVALKFQNPRFTCINFIFTEHIESLTIDTMYRGRCDIDGKLVEFEGDNGYFYIDFYEDFRLEFWCNLLIFERI